MKEIKSKDIILDTAEKLFAQKGYAGTSMRVIAEEAGTAQALIHYHYKTKEFLFESIVERRSKVINGNRQQRLRDCFEMEKNRFPSLEAIMESFIQPALECGRSSWGRDYSQILAKLANSDDERSRELVHKYYDPIAREYILALEKVLPNLSKSEIYWGYLIITSAVVSSMARTGRIKRLSEGSLDDNNTARMIARLVRFSANGLRGLVDLSAEEQKDSP